MFDDEYPCESCVNKDDCDGWEAQYCCTLCVYLGADDCEHCDPNDI